VATAKYHSSFRWMTSSPKTVVSFSFTFVLFCRIACSTNPQRHPKGSTWNDPISGCGTSSWFVERESLLL
jgi:hypothetical protein